LQPAGAEDNKGAVAGTFGVRQTFL